MIEKHLELAWTYKGNSEEISSTQVVKNLASNEITPPNREVLHKFLALVKDGDVQGIVEVAEHLSTSEPQFSPFTKEISKLAQSFQLSRLKASIEYHLGESI